MKKHYRCKYLIVGTGAGGSVAGALLAEAGQDVLFLEEGKNRSECLPLQVGQWIQKTYRNKGISPFFGSPVIPFAEASCVGGGTVINGGLIWRTPLWILDQWKKNGLTGYEYKNLEKHFETVEHDLHVTTHTLDETSNLDSLQLYNGAQKLGWKTAFAPRAFKPCQQPHTCPQGGFNCGKQSTLENYIPRALQKGARLLTNCRAIKIIHREGRARQLIAKTQSQDKSSVIIDFDYLVLAAGAIQTPHLLKRSRIYYSGKYPIQFHMNFKFVPFFDKKIYAHKGTIFTVQIQEFAKEGMLIMATYHTPHLLAVTLARHGKETINDGLNNYFRSAIFTTLVQPQTQAHILSSLSDQPLVWYRFNPLDIPKIRSALFRTSELLFASGATSLYLPIKNTPKISSLEEIKKYLEKFQPKDLDISIMHIMSSCPMGEKKDNSVVRPDGVLWNMKNILVADASILPSNIGESPQGTIMAFVHELIQRHLNDYSPTSQ